MLTLKVEPGPLPDLSGRQGRRVQTWHDLSEAVCAYGYAGPGWWAMEWPRLATFCLHSADAREVTAFGAPGTSPSHLADLHRRSVMPLFKQALGRETLHASAIRGSRGAIAFCGERGAGKSTVAYALARSGFEQYADDTLVLDTSANGVATEPLPFAPRLRQASLTFFRGSSPFRSPSPTLAPEPLAAVFVLDPVRHAAASRARPLGPHVRTLPPAEALQALLAHAHCFDPESSSQRRRLLRNYLEISAHVPVFRVLYEPGLERLDALLDTLLAAAGETRPAPITA